VGEEAGGWGADAAGDQKQELAAAQQERGDPGKKSGSEPARNTLPQRQRKHTETERKGFMGLLSMNFILGMAGRQKDRRSRE